MSRSLNKVVLIGYLGRTPEVRTTASGRRVATLSLATSHRWTGRDQEPRERTEWHRIVVWEPLVDLVGRQLQTGTRLFLEGRIEYRSWESRSGQRRYLTEIVAERIFPLDTG